MGDPYARPNSVEKAERQPIQKKVAFNLKVVGNLQTPIFFIYNRIRKKRKRFGLAGKLYSGSPTSGPTVCQEKNTSRCEDMEKVLHKRKPRSITP